MTIVTQDRSCLFGDVIEEKMRVNGAGTMVSKVWGELPERFPTIELDAFVVMPNHVHGIIVLQQPVGVPLVGTRVEGGQGNHKGCPYVGRYCRGVQVHNNSWIHERREGGWVASLSWSVVAAQLLRPCYTISYC